MIDVNAQFARTFGGRPDVIASAPGRVNLIGEHTDYNNGFVLPVAIPQRTTVALQRRSGGIVRAASVDAPPGPDAGAPWAAYDLGNERKGRGWVDYVQGLTWALAAAGEHLEGFDVLFASDVPLGAGLSSSAALEVALLRAARKAFGLGLDDVGIARVGQRAEAGFVGAPVGIMDQMASSLADETHALFLDARSLKVERVLLPEQTSLIVIASGVSHSHVGGEYRVRRQECERAAKLLGVQSLRDLGPGDLAAAASLPEPLGRRVRHVVTENARVLEAVAALRAGDVARVGALFAASHASMRDDFEVSTPDIDTLVAIAAADPAVLGARLTGGGFGGSIVALAWAGEAARAAQRIVGAYRARTGKLGDVLVPAPTYGVGTEGG